MGFSSKKPTTIGRTYEIIIARIRPNGNLQQLQMKNKPHNFQPNVYKLNTLEHLNNGRFTANLTIEGKKMPPPNKRITLHQNGLRIMSAKIKGKTKKGEVEFTVTRINHLKSFQEVRIHTEQTLYPGFYTIELTYSGKINSEKLKLIDQPEAWHKMSWRDILPCIDEPKVHQQATIEIIQD
jgi:aminopeptidase N